MLFNKKRSGNYLVLQIEEDKIDSSNSGRLSKLLNEIVESGEKNTIIDLSRVNFMDSSGLAGLLPIIKQAPKHGHVMLTGLQPRVRQLFKLTKVDAIVDIFSSVEEALIYEKTAQGAPS